ncbi:hypothetical protein BASA83_006654 [Batrachochytrium salamandrivorans]|nr:hypothetical protein BASA83_006654 [Batrachochytrium salamandrivorans]
MRLLLLAVATAGLETYPRWTLNAYHSGGGGGGPNNGPTPAPGVPTGALSSISSKSSSSTSDRRSIGVSGSIISATPITLPSRSGSQTLQEISATASGSSATAAASTTTLIVAAGVGGSNSLGMPVETLTLISVAGLALVATMLLITYRVVYKRPNAGATVGSAVGGTGGGGGDAATVGGSGGATGGGSSGATTATGGATVGGGTGGGGGSGSSVLLLLLLLLLYYSAASTGTTTVAAVTAAATTAAAVTSAAAGTTSRTTTAAGTAAGTTVGMTGWGGALAATSAFFDHDLKSASSAAPPHNLRRFSSAGSVIPLAPSLLVRDSSSFLSISSNGQPTSRPLSRGVSVSSLHQPVKQPSTKSTSSSLVAVVAAAAAASSSPSITGAEELESSASLLHGQSSESLRSRQLPTTLQSSNQFYTSATDIIPSDHERDESLESLSQSAYPVTGSLNASSATKKKASPFILKREWSTSSIIKEDHSTLQTQPSLDSLDNGPPATILRDVSSSSLQFQQPSLEHSSSTASLDMDSIPISASLLSNVQMLSLG